MHSINASVRLMALLIIAIAAVLAFASLSPGTQPRQVDAGPPPQPDVQAGITCNDVYLDFPPLQAKGAAHGPEDLLVGKLMTRIEPSQAPGATSKDFDLTTVTYLGPDLKPNDENAIDDLVPDKPPTLLPCQDKATNAGAAAEANQMNPSQPYEMASNFRPSTKGTLVFEGGTWNLESSTCTFSEEEQQWLRTDTNSVILQTGKGAMNFGRAVLNLGTDAPLTSGFDVDGDGKFDVALDPSECTNNAGTIAFGSILESVARNATTDHPGGESEDGAGSCANGLDDDALNGIDQLDPSCDPGGGYDPSLDEGGVVTNTCSDGVDNSDYADDGLANGSGDGLTDAADSDCGKNGFNKIATDPDGAVVDSGTNCDTPSPHSLANPKVKLEAECPDSADGLADDWDGDGCPDWDELDKDFINGRDPFNPNDCDVNYTGAYSAIATVQAATDGVPGSYFTAMVAIQHDKVTNMLTGALQVYLDSALLGAAGPKTTVWAKIDGLPDVGPYGEPPPPYTLAAPSTVNGTFDKVNQLLILDFCINDIGGLFAPNAVAHAEVDAHTLKGTVDIYGNQTKAACASKTPNPNAGVPPNTQVVLPGVRLVLVEQGANQNHDKDGCTDMEELLGTGPATCGDDPYNPHDSDENFTSVGNLLATVCTPPGFPTGVCGADWDKTLNEIIPSPYYHCIYELQHDTGTNGLTARTLCYIDSTTAGIGQINPEACPGVGGDGIEGAGPPWPPAKNPPPYEECWADMADNHTVLTGNYDPVGHTLNLAGCFADKDGFGAQGNVHVTATIDSGTGQGSANITILIPDQTDCENGITGAGVPFPTAQLELVEQANETKSQGPPVEYGNGAGYDTDRDGCSDKEELQNDPVFGGLRDPFKYWDFYDVDQNRQIALGDFLGVLGRFGASDLGNTTPINRHTNPLTAPPAAPAYHPRFDRGGQQPGTVGLGWNELAPNGQIALGDFLSLLRQFGHTCIPGPNDVKYPYLAE